MNKHYPDRPRKAPRDSMRTMVRRKLDKVPTVEDFKRALRHAAHLYVAISNRIRSGAELADSAHANAIEEDLYAAARALDEAEKLLGVRE